MYSKIHMQMQRAKNFALLKCDWEDLRGLRRKSAVKRNRFPKKGANILIKLPIFIILYFANIFSPIILLMQFYCVIITNAFTYTRESDILRSWCSKYGLRTQQLLQMSLLEMQNHILDLLNCNIIKKS